MALALKPICGGVYHYVHRVFVVEALNAARIDGRRGLSETEIFDSAAVAKAGHYTQFVPACIAAGLADGKLVKRGTKISIAKGAKEPKRMQHDGFARAMDCPAEVMSTVLSFLDARTLGAAAAAGRALPRADAATWRNLAQTRYPMTQTLEDVSDWREIYRSYTRNFVAYPRPRPKNPAVPGIDEYSIGFELWNDYPNQGSQSTMLLQSGTLRPLPELAFGDVGSDEDNVQVEFEVVLSNELKTLVSLGGGDIWARVAITRRGRPGSGMFVCFDGWITDLHVENCSPFRLGMLEPLDIRAEEPDPVIVNKTWPSAFCGIRYQDSDVDTLEATHVRLGFAWVDFDEDGDWDEMDGDAEDMTPGELLQLLHRLAFFD